MNSRTRRHSWEILKNWCKLLILILIVLFGTDKAIKVNAEEQYTAPNSRPRESHSGGREWETIIAGPYQSITTSFCMSRDRDAEGVEREGTCEGVFPYYPTIGVWGAS